jgi:hypothetical protein
VYLQKFETYGRILTVFCASLKKQSGLLFKFYVALTVINVFSFIAVDPMSSVCFEAGNTEHGSSSITENNYFMQQPAEGMALVFKTRNTQASLHAGFQRVISVLSLSVIGNIFSKLSIMSNAKIKHIILKNTISLKLRI